MLHTISSELLTLKQKKRLSFCAVIPLLYLLRFLHAGSKMGVEDTFLDFRFLLADSYFFILLLHALVIGLLGVSLFYDENRADAVNRMAAYPVSTLRFFLSKLFIIFIFSLFIMFTAAAELTLLGAVISNTGFNMTNIIFTFRFYILIAVTLPLGLMPIFFIMTSCRHSSVIPIASLIFYLSLTILPGLGIIRINSSIIGNIFEYLYPFGSMAMIQRECLYKMMPSDLLGWTESSTYIPLCILCLLTFAVFFILLSITSLKRQKADYS